MACYKRPDLFPRDKFILFHHIVRLYVARRAGGHIAPNGSGLVLEHTACVNKSDSHWQRDCQWPLTMKLPALLSFVVLAFGLLAICRAAEPSNFAPAAPQLLGTLFLFDEPEALLATPEGQVTLTVGGSVGQIKLLALTIRTAVIENEGRIQELHLQSAILTAMAKPSPEPFPYPVPQPPAEFTP